MDYHLLSDFRVEHQEALDELLTQIVATLMAQDLVTLAEVAQDPPEADECVLALGRVPFAGRRALRYVWRKPRSRWHAWLKSESTQTQGSPVGNGLLGNGRPGSPPQAESG